MRPSQIAHNGRISQGAGSSRLSFLSESEFIVQELRYTDWALIDTKSTNALCLNEMQARTKPGCAGSQLYQSGSAFQIQVSASCSSLKISTTVPAPALCFNMRASTI